MIANGAGPSRSAFLSAFFSLVGCHGLHVTLRPALAADDDGAGVQPRGTAPDIMRRMLCFSLFWHALDIIWVAVFTVVYLLGAGRMTRPRTALTLTAASRAISRAGDALEDEGHGVIPKVLTVYLAGLGLAVFLTFLSFLVIVHTNLVWAPSIPVALCVLAVAQMGVHLVFFIHITTGPDNTEQHSMALAFGILIVFLVLGGTLYIIPAHEPQRCCRCRQIMQMQR